MSSSCRARHGSSFSVHAAESLRTRESSDTTTVGYKSLQTPQESLVWIHAQGMKNLKSDGCTMTSAWKNKRHWIKKSTTWVLGLLPVHLASCFWVYILLDSDAHIQGGSSLSTCWPVSQSSVETPSQTYPDEGHRLDFPQCSQVAMKLKHHRKKGDDCEHVIP